jgi:hypothetical protein
MADQDKKIIDHAATASRAWKLVDTYLRTKNILGLDDYAIGVDRDPVKGPDGQWGFRVYAVLKKEEP